MLHYLPGTPGWLRIATDFVVVLHVAGGVAGVAAGAGALALRKGEHWHRLAGTVFFAAMLTLGSTAALIGLVLNEPGNVFGGVFVCYMVATAWMTVRRPEGTVGRFELGAALVVLVMAALGGLGAVQAAQGHGSRAVAAASAFIALIAAIAAVADVSVILRRGVRGAQRVARHLWRMCVGFWMAAAAFVTQPSMFPHPAPLLVAAAMLPLVLMIFWLLVVALTGRFKGDPISEAAPTQAA